MPIINTHHLVMFNDTVGMYCENHTKVINMVCGKRQNLLTSRQVIHIHNCKAFKRLHSNVIAELPWDWAARFIKDYSSWEWAG